MGQALEDPIHPGDILAEELEFIGLNAAELADKIGVPKNRMYQIIKGERSITADTALRLGKFFGSGPRVWLNLQKAYELDIAETQMSGALESIETYKDIRHELTHPRV
jgi:addiction module HigA family antidote